MRWFIFSVIVGGLAAAALLVRSHFGGGRPEVGAVSDQWIAEHHTDRTHF